MSKTQIIPQLYWPVADALGISLSLKDDGVVTRSSGTKLRKYSDMGVELMLNPDIHASNFTKEYMWLYLHVEGTLALFVTFDVAPRELFIHVVNEAMGKVTPAHIDGKPLSEAFGEVWNSVIKSYGWDSTKKEWVTFNAEDLFVVEGPEGDASEDDTQPTPHGEGGGSTAQAG